MVSVLVHCRNAAADWSGTGWKAHTYICRGSDRQIEPLDPDVVDVVSDVLEIVHDIITVGVRLVDI